jgi:hypothetical protein
LLTAAALAGCALPAENLRRDRSLAWILDKGPTGARLMLGAPDSDDIRVMMSCQPHSGAVDIMIAARPGDSAGVELHSGKVWNRYRGAGHADEETSGAVDIDLQKLSADDPVLAAFADTGDLSVVFQPRKVVLPNAFAPAHDFLAICRRP